MLDNFPAPWQKKLSSMAGNSGNVPAPEPAESSILVLHKNEEVENSLDKTAAEICDAFYAGKFVMFMYSFTDNGRESTSMWFLDKISVDEYADIPLYVFEFYAGDELSHKYYVSESESDYPFSD